MKGVACECAQEYSTNKPSRARKPAVAKAAGISCESRRVRRPLEE